MISSSFCSSPSCLACAENYLLSDYNAHILSNPNDWGDNNFNGFQWFTSSFMLGNNIMKFASKQNNSESIEIYPQPAIDHFFIHSEGENSEFKLINFQGVVVHKGLIHSKEEKINIDLPPGVYLFQFDNSDLKNKILVVRN